MKTRVVAGVVLIAAAVALYLIYARRPPAPTPQPAAAPDKGAVVAEKPPGRPRGGGGDGEARLAPRVDVADDPAGGLLLEGEVIDEAKQPVAGAVVGLSSHPPRTARTREDGSFEFDKLLPRQYTLEARKEDGHGGPVTVRVTPTKEPVIIVLKATGGLEVTVVAKGDHKPVAGAEVEAGDEPLAAEGTTGDDGKVVLKGLEPGLTEVVARAPGFAPAMALADAPDRAGAVTRQTIELKRGAAVSGKVVDSAGKPIAGAHVRPDPTSALFDLPGGRKAAVTSDSAGAWSFPALPEGTFRFAASDDRHAPGSSSPVTLDGKTDRTEILITLGAGARIAGQVVRGGAPVPGAAVRLVTSEARWQRDDGVRQVSSDDKGRFEIAGLARRKVEVVASDDQASSQQLSLDLEATPEQTGLTLSLEVDGVIAGTVVSPTGEAVADAQVAAMPEMGGRRFDPSGLRLRGFHRDTTDSAGKFELHGLPDGIYRLRVGRGGGMLAMLQRTNVTAKTGDRDVRLVLEDDGRIKGRVLYADGSAPETFTVSAEMAHGTPFSGGDGAFEIDAPPGPATLSVSGPSFVQRTVSGVIVKGGETADVGTITVEQGRSLSGTVVGPTGAPVAGAKVIAGPQLMGSGSELSSGGLFGGGANIKSTTSGDDGSYLLAGVGARALVIVAEGADGRSNMVRVPAGTGSAQIDLTLRPFGALEGHITAAGKPVGPGLVMAQPQQASRGTLMVQSGEDGTYRFDKLAPDSYRVSAMRQGNFMRGGGLQAKVVVIEPEKTSQLDIELPSSGINVTLTIEPPAGTQVGAAQVILVSGGTFSAANADQFNERIGEVGAGSLHQGFILKGEPVKLENVEPGVYSACGIPFPGDINSPRDMIKLRDQMDKLAVACQPARVAPSPAEQSIAIKVPAPPQL